MEIKNQLQEKLRNLHQLAIFLKTQIDSHTNLINSNEALLNRIPQQFHDSDLPLMRSRAILNVMKAELIAFFNEMQMVELRISNVKIEISLLIAEGEAEG
ncbi:MAG TPA: hypothetical protein VGB63_13210 [Pedobacter sp.]|jgi:hypothetical protein